MSTDVSNIRPEPDKILVELADYAANFLAPKPRSDRYGAVQFARYVGLRLDCIALSRMHEASRSRRSRRYLVQRRAGTAARMQLDPVHAAFNIGAMIRWLDFNDTWLAAEWGHPSDNLGGILAVADYLTRAGSSGRPCATS